MEAKNTILNQKPFLGRKKSAVAKCNLYDANGSGVGIFLNNRMIDDEMSSFIHYHLSFVLKNLNNLLIKVWVKGGGVSSQRYAMIKAISKAFVHSDPGCKPEIKSNPYL